MLSLSTTQLAIISSAYKKISWLFEVIPADKLTTYFWSTVTRSYGGFDYTYKIPPSSFQGITLNRAKSELNIQAPNDLSFTVLNSDRALSASDFINGSVILRLVVSDGTNEDQIRIWKFDVKQCESQYRKLLFVCQDFVQKYLDGDYPNTKLVKDILRSTDTDLDDNICVTVPFGECYSPLRSLYVTDGRYYVLGGGSGETGTGSGETYAIQRVRSPRSQGAKSEWNSGEYTFSQSEKTIGLETWDVFQPIIADSDADGVADACGLWKDGDHFEDMPTQFLRSDTASLTNPADVIEFVLENIGVREMEFDFGTSFDVYAGWGLNFNGSYFYKQPREKVLAQLVNMCHSTLIVTDRVELHVLSKVSQKTITKADVIRTQEIGEGTFRRTAVTQDQSDSGHIAFQEADEAQDEFLKALVPAKSSMDNISSEILEIPFVQDSQDAQRIGILYYQRKLLREADIGFTSKGTLLALQPDDVITIDHADYGGTYDVLIDSMTINRDISIDFQCTKFSEDLDDWEDLSPYAITFVTDDTGTYWAPVICGPTGTASTGQVPSVVPGPLIVGVPPAEYILIDPANQKIESSDYVSGSAGTGFHLSPDLLEVGNIACRGIFRTAVFQKDVLSVVSGGVVVTKGGDVLAEDMTALDASTLKIEGNETFPVGDLLRIKNENDDEWLEVTNIASAPTYTVTRDKEGAYGADSNPAWTKGASVTNYGQSGDGGVLLTASETNAPYMNIFTHAGSPWSALTERLRIGNLNGFLGYASDLYGIAIGETNKYLKYDPTNGLRIQATKVVLLGGTDMELIGSDTDPGIIQFVGTSYTTKIGANASGQEFSIMPVTSKVMDLWIGGDQVGRWLSNHWEDIYLVAENRIRLFSEATYLSQHAKLDVYSHASKPVCMHGEFIGNNNQVNFWVGAVNVADSEQELYLTFYDTDHFDVMRIQDEGIITFAKQSACRVYLSANQSINSTTWTKINFNTENYDVQGEFDSVTNYKFTATEAGKYAVVVCVRLMEADDTEYVYAAIYKNGALASTSSAYSPGTDKYLRPTHSDVLSLAANDYIEGYVYHNHASARSITGGYSHDSFMAISKIA